uniref:Uncharacterized protein n=1 Tax=Mycena chlorophos TaxID=658473 RepID=A0ABQ0L1S3_MYCCL|nr:predicted protein [Mycena chlorophos]
MSGVGCIRVPDSEAREAPSLDTRRGPSKDLENLGEDVSLNVAAANVDIHTLSPRVPCCSPRNHRTRSSLKLNSWRNRSSSSPNPQPHRAHFMDSIARLPTQLRRSCPRRRCYTLHRPFWGRHRFPAAAPRLLPDLHSPSSQMASFGPEAQVVAQI